MPPRTLWVGASLALLSAALFGVSTPLAKILLGSVDPWMLAAILYLGSGIGLAVYRLFRQVGGASAELPLTRHDWRWFGPAILAGGAVGPGALMLGLVTTPASTASLLLNLEGVVTALLAWFVFRENFDLRIALGMAAVVVGAVVLSVPSRLEFAGFAGPLYIAIACAAWGLDNNLTRKVALKDAAQIAMWKGLIAGTVNLMLALILGSSLPSFGAGATAGLVGLGGYGVSIVLFVIALRHLGTARTGAYFSTAPFVGAVVAIIWLGDEVSPQLFLAGGLMVVGIWLHLTERHEHSHEHTDLLHSHRHRHDLHHRHEHDPDVDPHEPHAHLHRHHRVRHSHAHYPDMHHDHEHKPG